MINKREEIPKLVKIASHFLTEEMEQRLLREYKTISERKVEKVYKLLTEAIAKHKKEDEEKITKGQEKLKEVHKTLDTIHQREEAIRSQELAELDQFLETELNKIIIQ